MSNPPLNLPPGIRTGLDMPTTRRLTIDGWGLEKVGKTYFGSTMPRPLYIMNFEPEPSHISAFRSEDVFIQNFPGNEAILTEELAMQLLTMANQFVSWALGQGTGSIMIDSGTSLRDIAVTAKMGEIRRKRAAKDQQLFPFDYQIVNAEFRHMLTSISKSPLNLYITHQAKGVYDATGNPTGKHEPRENSQMPYLADVVLRLFKTQAEGQPPLHMARIETCRDNTALEGRTITSPTYRKLVKIIERDASGDTRQHPTVAELQIGGELQP